MYNNKRILAIIPARSGSKGLKDKNIKELDGKPLLAYSIEVALKSNIIDEVFVSTDSEIYAEIARKNGASVPFLRPKEISDDKSQAYDYITHTIQIYKEELKLDFDYFIVLQPTSPIREVKHIIEVAKLLIDHEKDSVVSVCEADHIPQLYNHLPQNLSMYKFYIGEDKSFNRQDFGKYYRLNGSIYGMKVKAFFKYKSYYIKNSSSYIMDKIFSIDIDDEIDFFLAEKILELKGVNSV